MASLARSVLDMMRLRSGPQDLPASRALTVILAIAYVSQGFVAGSVLGEPDSAPRTILAIAVQFGVVLAMLNMRNLQQRVDQTISALSATGFLFSVVSIAVLSRLQPGETDPNVALIYLALFIWSLIVDAHIYRHAFSFKMSMGVLVSVSIFAANLVLLQMVFG